MRKILLTFLAVCSTCIATAQDLRSYVKSIVEDLQHINGNAYSVITKKYDLENKFGELTPTNIVVLDTAYFNAPGIINRVALPDGKSSYYHCSELQFRYNANNTIDEIHCGHSVFKYTYNNKVVKIDETTYDDGTLIGRETWSYTPNGFVYTIYGYSGDVEDILTYAGNRLTKKSDSGTWTINADKKPVRYYFDNQNFKYLETWTYDSHGNETRHKSQFWRKFGNEWVEGIDRNKTVTTSYEYDIYGNWTKKCVTTTTIEPQKAETVVTERIFTYFDTPEALVQHVQALEAERERAEQEAAQARIEAENARRAQEEERLRLQELQRQEREERAEQLTYDHRIRSLSHEFRNQIRSTKKGDSYTFAYDGNWNKVKPSISENGAYSFVHKMGNINYGPFLFTGHHESFDVTLLDTKIREFVKIPFEADFTIEKDAAMVYYDKHKFICIFDTDGDCLKIVQLK